MPLYDLVAQVEKKTKTKTKPKMTRQITKHVENATNLSPFDKSITCATKIEKYS